jgi:hypothetical protein
MPRQGKGKMRKGKPEIGVQLLFGFTLWFLLSSCDGNPMPDAGPLPLVSTLRPQTPSGAAAEPSPTLTKDLSPTPTEAYGHCPEYSSADAPFPEFLFSDNPQLPEQQESDVLSYLHRYGPDPLIEALEQEGDSDLFVYQDFTNDGVPELGLTIPISIGGVVSIYSCQDGAYRILYNRFFDFPAANPCYMVLIHDGNRNAYPEITFLVGVASQGSHTYQMIEWDGTGIVDRLRMAITEYPYWSTAVDFVWVHATGGVGYEDIDADGIDEFVVNTGFPVWETYYSGLPFQNVIRYHTWDGSRYSFDRQFYGPPEFRFQAVQDGDRLTEAEEYDLALDMYRQAVSNEALEWWTEERHKFLQEIWMSDEPTPNPPSPDPDEYPNLAAYARYRMMIAYLLQGDLDTAQSEFIALKGQFPEGKIGHAYFEMADALWREIQTTNDLRSACEKPIEYAMNHPVEILAYLGNGEYAKAYYGHQSIVYSWNNVCPFHIP